MRILGIDASTTTVGLAVIDFDGKTLQLINLEFFKPPKKGNIFERLDATTKFLGEFLDIWKPDHVAIEDIVLFMARASTAKTITALAIFNRTVGLFVYQNFHIEPTLLSVMKIRHALKPTKTLPKKEEMPEIVAKHLNIDFPYVLQTKGKNKGKPKEESMDMADSCAVALTYLKLHKGWKPL